MLIYCVKNCHITNNNDYLLWMKLIFIIVAAVLKQNLPKNCGIKSQALMGVVIKYAHLIYLNPRVVTENEI